MDNKKSNVIVFLVIVAILLISTIFMQKETGEKVNQFSTTKIQEYAKNDENCKFIFKIYTEKGMECAFVIAGNKHALFDEHEVLLPRRTKFEINKMTKHKDTVIIECKVVKQNEG